jgi:quercetin dioxygenase-like cupin family protein
MSNERSGMSPSEVHGLAGLVEYGEESIVSRVLAKNDAGTVTLFAFDKEQALSEHSAPFDALVQCVEGEIEVTIAGTVYPLEAGHVVLMPKDVPHAVRAPSRCKMLLTMLRGS